MKHVVFATFLSLVLSAGALAQTSRGELYLGYSNGHTDTGGVGPATQAATGVGDRSSGYHGFGVAGVYNLSRYFGLKADMTGTYNKRHFTFPVTTGASTQTVTFDRDSSLYNFLGGVQVKDNSTTSRLKPFAHALAGIAHTRNRITGKTCVTTVQINCAQIVDHNESGFAMAFGGGLDVRVNDRFDLRLVQFDYNPITFDESTSTNYRIGIGIVIK